MDRMRRNLLGRLGGAGMVTALFAAGLLKPLKALAAEWNKSAFEAKDVNGAMSAIGAGGAAESKDIVLNAPGIAENGSVVPISVVSNIPGTTEISVFVDQNPFPLAGSFRFSGDALPDVGVRLKFGKTSTVRAVVMANGKAYTTWKDVKVTAGGCGG
jgi:sulfur-oxidizing protein SoxY